MNEIAILDSSDNTLWAEIGGFLSLKSENTGKTYLSVIKEWVAFLGKDAGTPDGAAALLSADQYKAISYVTWLKKQIGQTPRIGSATKSRLSIAKRDANIFAINDGTQATLAAATIRKKLVALRRIYRFLNGRGFFNGPNPFHQDIIPPPKQNSGLKRPTEMVDFNLVRQIIDSPGVKTPRTRQQQAILAILFGGGLRRSEVVKLRIGDVKNTDKGTTYLYLRATKSGKDAEQALPAWTAPYITAVITDRKLSGAHDGDFLFVHYLGSKGNVHNNAPLTGAGIYEIFTRTVKKLGVEKIVTPHSARATAITKLLDAGVNHREVQEFSRHASIQMVELYDKRRFGIDNSPAKKITY